MVMVSLSRTVDRMSTDRVKKSTPDTAARCVSTADAKLDKW